MISFGSTFWFFA